MNMHGRLFALVTIDDDSKIFAWGMEIETHGSDCTDDVVAVIYRKDPATGRTVFGEHDSAQAAADRWSSIVPVEVSWEESHVPTAANISATDPAPETSCDSLPGAWRIEPSTQYAQSQPFPEPVGIGANG